MTYLTSHYAIITLFRKRKNHRRRSNGSSNGAPQSETVRSNGIAAATILTTAALQKHQDGPQPDDPSDDPDDKMSPRKWARRVAKYALPFQVALIAIICAVCCLEPHCCDSLNSMSMSFTPQLRYVRGPPPI